MRLMMNDEVELPDGSHSVSDIQDYIKYIIKKHETLTKIPRIDNYINRINNRLLFKKGWIYDRITNSGNNENIQQHKKKLIDKAKNGKNVPGLEAFEVVLVQYNLVHNRYQQKSEFLWTFTPNKSYVDLLNVEPSNLMFLETHNTEFDEIIITFTGQNGRPLEIKD